MSCVTDPFIPVNSWDLHQCEECPRSASRGRNINTLLTPLLLACNILNVDSCPGVTFVTGDSAVPNV